MTKFEFPFVLEVGEIHYVYNSISFDTKKGIETLVLNKQFKEWLYYLSRS